MSGSPTKDGNNDKIINYVGDRIVAKGFDAEKIFISRSKIGYCTACNLCKKELGKCSIKDSMDDVRAKLEDADAIIVSSPVYFGSVTAQIKALFDRSLPLRRNNFKLKNKIGAAIAVGGSRNGGQEYTIQAIHSWMNISGMIVVGDDSHFGGIVEAPFENDDVGRKTVDATVDKVCEVLKKIGTMYP